MVSVSELNRCSTGIEGLDRMLNGGLIRGRSYLLVGNSGSGRSLLASHFLMNGIENGEEVLYVAIDEPPADINANLMNFGWDPGKITILNAHPKVRDYKARGSLIEVAAQRSVGALKEMNHEKKSLEQSGVAPDLSLPGLQLMLQKEFERRSYDRLVIDSLSILRLIGSKEIEWELGINSIFRLLSEENVTTLLISDDSKPGEEVRPETFLSRGIIRCRRLISKGKIYRCVYIEKLRGSSHDFNIRPLRITFRGIEVDDKKVPPPGVLRQLSFAYPRR